ncbi:hypothetical protein [Nocardia grenadensis]|uniref:hypothetical protein n=1 Tax=Nocardia grenadensis TaxID=931537 RepID=UPI003D8BF98F
MGALPGAGPDITALFGVDQRRYTGIRCSNTRSGGCPNWEARVLYEESTGVLFCGDLMTQLGDGPTRTGADLMGPAEPAEDVFHATSLGPAVPATLRRSAESRPTTLAVMHGSSFTGNGSAALGDLATVYEHRLGP